MPDAPGPILDPLGELERTLAAWTASLAQLGGCSDGNCVIQKPKGMHTNGGCHCSEDRNKARRAMALASYQRERIAALVRAMREGPPTLLLPLAGDTRERRLHAGHGAEQAEAAQKPRDVVA